MCEQALKDQDPSAFFDRSAAIMIAHLKLRASIHYRRRAS
jgi:hypothetical protein